MSINSENMMIGAAAAAEAGASAGAASAAAGVSGKPSDKHKQEIANPTDASMQAFFKAFIEANRGNSQPIEMWNAALRKKFAPENAAMRAKLMEAADTQK